MKNRPILYSPLAFLPLDALAHPGHAAGAITAGVAAGYFLILLALPVLGAAIAALWIYRRRQAARDDD